MTEAAAPEVRLTSVDQRLVALFEAAQRWIYEQGLVLEEIESILARLASYSGYTVVASRQRISQRPSGLPAN